MHTYTQNIVIIFVVLLLPIVVSAETNIDNKTLSCSAKHLDTDKLVEVKIVSSIAGKKIATAQWPLGYPTIAIDDSAFVKLPTAAKQFVFYHECAHLKLRASDEQVMDCESINLLVSQNDYSEIDVRRLIQTLTQEFGWSKRWSKLLNCGNF
jgi:hypothetical protein